MNRATNIVKQLLNEHDRKRILVQEIAREIYADVDREDDYMLDDKDQEVPSVHVTVDVTVDDNEPPEGARFDEHFSVMASGWERELVGQLTGFLERELPRPWRLYASEQVVQAVVERARQVAK